MVTSELTVSWLPPRTMVCPCTAGANSIRSAVRLSASASASASRKVSTPSSAVTSLVVVTMKVVPTGGGLGVGLVQLEGADVGVGALRRGPGHAALVGRRGRGRIGPAERRVVGRVAQGDGLGRPAIVGEPAREQQARRHVLAIARGIAVDVAAEDVEPVAGSDAARDVGVGAAGGGVARDDAVA